MPAKNEEEFELVPLSPIRRLEKRIDRLESTSGGVDVREFFRELVAIIRMNQEIVDELAKSSDALRIEISKLPAKLEEVTNNLNELLSYIKAAAFEEARGTAPESLTPLTEKMDKLIEINKKIIEGNENVASVLETIAEKLKPSLPLRPPILKPLLR